MSPRNSFAENLKPRRMLPMKFSNGIHNAIADSGSVENIIEESFMRGLGASIEVYSSTRAEFVNARGGRMQSIGTCQIPCSFPTESGTYSTVFHVFKKLVTPLIIGRKFLDDTETLSRFPDRLKRLLNRSTQFLRVLQMELPQRMINCSVDGQNALATADSGSEADLVSLDYALKMGYEISRPEHDQSQLQFADGEVVSVYGTIDVDLALSSFDEGKSSNWTTLHVLPGLTSNILLGDETLERLEAFTKHQDAFVDARAPYEYQSPLQYIAWYTRAEKMIQRAFSRISGRDSSPDSTRGSIQPNNPQSQSESTYQHLVRAFDKPMANDILLQGMEFEKCL